MFLTPSGEGQSPSGDRQFLGARDRDSNFPLEQEDPWTPSPVKRDTRRRRVGERVYSYVAHDETWDTAAVRKADAKRTPREAWKAWGDFVYDPLSVSSEGKEFDYKTYETRATKRGSKPSMRYAMKTPYATYSQFGAPEMVDASGRQYKWADGSDAALLSDRGVQQGIGRPHDASVKRGGRDSLLYIRFPRGSRGQLAFPEPESKISMVDLASGNLYMGTVGWIGEGEDPVRSATGSVFIYGLKNEGLAPQEYIEQAVSRLPRKYLLRRKNLLSS